MNTPASTSDRFEQLANLTRTLAHAHRLALLEHIAQGERAVERLAELSGLSVANTSQHLQQLRRAGLVQARREGKRILYSLGDGPILDVLSALHGLVGHQQQAIQTFISSSLQHPDHLEHITLEELASRLDEGSVTLLDVRPEEEFALGHIPGAINIPAAQLASRLSELKPDHHFVAYCRGPFCTFSTGAVALLSRHGFHAARLQAGFPEWKAAGKKVADDMKTDKPG